MSARYMLDTDICIYLKKRRPPAVTERFQHLQWGEVVISVVTYGELLTGALKSQQQSAALQNVQRLVKRLPVQSLSIETGEIYADIRSRLELQGNIIGNNDLWIAAHALSLELTLVSNNIREFSRIEGLRLENWAG